MSKLKRVVADYQSPALTTINLCLESPILSSSTTSPFSSVEDYYEFDLDLDS